jgi:hypothetical protein
LTRSGSQTAPETDHLAKLRRVDNLALTHSDVALVVVALEEDTTVLEGGTRLRVAGSGPDEMIGPTAHHAENKIARWQPGELL